ncbi:MAG: aldo/keto reductase [Gemmatimonadota bacterium]|jgi:aryl-alcohol dehydrogenase-like predicted oxidoreductase
MTLSRREAIRLGVGLGALGLLDARRLWAWQEASLITKPIPSTGERIPVIGLGSARTFNLDPSSAEAAEPLRVVRLFEEHRGTVIDTAPSYGRSEAFVGRAVGEIDAAGDLFLATKVNVEGRGMDAALAQMEESSRVLGKRTVDLMQVWNLGDNFRSLGDRYLAAHLEAVREWKRRGRTRYIGITTSFAQQYGLVEAALRREELDFVQLDYSIGDREPEQRLLPLAADRGVAVLVNQPFSTGGLFSRVAGRELPTWAEDFDCDSWAQFFLKYIVSHPAVTCAIPATSDPEHLVDNMGASVGRLPDESERRRMVEVFEAL